MTWVAIVAALAVVLGFVTAILGLINQRKITKAAHNVQQIAVSVDGQMSGMFLRIDQLIQSMHNQGAVVPPAPTPGEIAESIQAKNGGTK
jgi:hypothetical protein